MTQQAIGAAAPSIQKNLEMLFDYTKFHIGLYLTLTASYVTVTSIRINEKPVFRTHPVMVQLAVMSFMLAGFAGGVIASSITQTDALSSSQFLKQQIGPWEITFLQTKALTWTWIEHTSFWVGLLLAVLSIRRETNNDHGLHKS